MPITPQTGSLFHAETQINKLTVLMLAVFSDVTIFSENIRHHSQGVSLGDRQGRVTEFVLVGRP
jgi:hypothetical protein